MNGEKAAEIIAKAAWEKNESNLDTRYSKLEKSLNRLVADYVTPNTRQNAMLGVIAEDLENLAKAFKKLNEDQHAPVPELSNEEEEDALADYEAEQTEAAKDYADNQKYDTYHDSPAWEADRARRGIPA